MPSYIQLFQSSSFSNSEGTGSVNMGVNLSKQLTLTDQSGNVTIIGAGGGSIDTGSLVTTASFNAFTSSIQGQVNSLQSVTSSYVTNSQTSSMSVATASFASTASYVQNAQTASYVLNAISSSYASTASYVKNAQTASYLNTLNQDLIFNGNLTLNGTASIAYLNVTYESASVIYSSGSNQLGDATNDTQTLIGTVIVSGSQRITGSLNVSAGITGSLFGTSSWASNATTASYVLNAVSSSFSSTSSYVVTAQTASYVLNAISSSFATSASRAVTASYILNAVSSSYALTASYALNAGSGGISFPYTGSAVITGSLVVTGSTTSTLGFTGSLFGTSSWARSASWAPGSTPYPPSGSTGNIQYKSGSVFGGDPNFNTNGAGSVSITGSLTIENTIDTGNYRLIDGGSATSLNWRGTNNGEHLTTGYYFLKSIATGSQEAFIVDTIDNSRINYEGEAIVGTIDSAVQLYDLVSLESDGLWYQVDQTNNKATKMLGICLDLEVGRELILLEGNIVAHDGNGANSPKIFSVDHGLPVYIKEGTTTGEMDTTMPTNGSNYLRRLGHCYYNSSTNSAYWIFKFRPSNDWTII
jgi:hypothetical protein